MAQPRGTQVFLSYSSQDKPFARDLHRLLSDAGIRVWFDEIATVPGSKWDSAVRDAIAHSSLAMMLVGERALERWHSFELRALLDRVSADDEFLIIPVLLPGSKIENLPAALRGYQSIDLRDAHDEDLKLKRIAAALTTDPETGELAESEEIGDRLREGGDFNGAIPLYLKALAIGIARLGEDHPAVARVQRKLGASYLGIGDFDKAEHRLRIALDLNTRSYGNEDVRVVADLSNLATLYEYRGNPSAAQELQLKVLEISRRVLGEDHPDTLTAMNNLAGTFASLGDLSESRALGEEVLAVRRRVLGEDHPDTLTSLSNLAATLTDMGDLGGARAMHEQVLEGRRRILGDEHPNTLTSMNNLASTLRAMGEVAGARALQEYVLSTSQRLLGTEHPATITSMNNLAGTLWSEGEFSSARLLLQQALAAYRRLGDHPNTAVLLTNLATMDEAMGNQAEAAALYAEAGDIFQRSLGPEHPATKRVQERQKLLREKHNAV